MKLILRKRRCLFIFKESFCSHSKKTEAKKVTPYSMLTKASVSSVLWGENIELYTAGHKKQKPPIVYNVQVVFHFPHAHSSPTLSARDKDETFGLHDFRLQAMLKRVFNSLRQVEHTDENPRRKNKVRGTKASPGFGLQFKDFIVRIVHQGGEHEVYQHAFPASKLMAKYPGTRVARPEVFKAPHKSLLHPEESLLLGQKYIIISSRDVEKLKRKHPQQDKTKEVNGVVTRQTLEEKFTRSPRGHKHKENGKLSVPNGVASQEMVDTRITLSPNECKIREKSEVKETNGLTEEKVNAKMNLSQGGGAVVEESYCSAKDFYVTKDKSRRYSRPKGIKRKKPFVPPLPKARSYRGLGWQPSLATVQELSP